MKRPEKERFAIFLKEKGFSADNIDSYLLQLKLYELWLLLDDLKESKIQLDLYKVWLITQDIEQQLKEIVHKKVHS